MRLTRLKLEHFRLVDAAEFGLAPEANLFLGRNAQGKTTVLEAVHYLSAGRSFRTAKDRELLPIGAGGDAFAACEGNFEDAYAGHEVRMALTAGAKSLWLDAKPLRRLTELCGRLNAVCFLPSDLELIRGAPAARRGFLDSLLARTRPEALEALGAYATALGHRNALLRRSDNVPGSECAAYEDQMAKYGARVLIAREQLARGLAPPARQNMHALTDGCEEITFRHEPGLSRQAAREVPLPGASGPGEGEQHGEAIAEALRALWEKARRDDFLRGSTQYGPHRAELRIELNGQEARPFASQGQARAAALSLRLAEARWIEDVTGQLPVLLLDDVLGELDRQRSEHFVHLLSRPGVQSLLTATDLPALGDQLPIGARFDVEGGRITRR